MRYMQFPNPREILIDKEDMHPHLTINETIGTFASEQAITSETSDGKIFESPRIRGKRALNGLGDVLGKTP